MEYAVCIGMDALRICIGKKPQNYTLKEIIEWMERMDFIEKKTNDQN